MVASVNDAVEARDDVARTQEDTGVTFDLLGNDRDVDGDVLTISPQTTTSATLVLSGGHVVARGTLGQMDGFRAIRIGTGETPLHKPNPGPGLQDVTRTMTGVVPMEPKETKLDYGGSLDVALSEIASELPEAIVPQDG